MTRRIWLAQPHLKATLSRFGTTMLVGGIAFQGGATISDASMALRQGDLSVSGTCLLHRGLMLPDVAARAYGSAAGNLRHGFAIAVTFPFDPALRTGLAAIDAVVTWSDGQQSRLRLATVSLEKVEPQTFARQVDGDTIGIALAAFNPNFTLFQRQVASIRSQSDTNWVCVICDDGSDPATLAQIAGVIQSDDRFRLVPTAGNVGVYRNFERAVAALPAECGWVAFSDQDDEWEPNKLERLRAEALKTRAPLVFSDMSVTDDSGRRLSPTFWINRRLEFDSLAAMAFANTVTGMATLVPASLLGAAMPFPALPGTPYHDGWFALSASARGNIAYVDEPLVRYVQHGGNHTGVFRRPPGALSLLGTFAGRLASLVPAVLRGRPRTAFAQALSLFASWSSGERLALQLKAETLQQRLARPAWRLSALGDADALAGGGGAIFHLPPRSWGDSHRRGVVTGLLLGSITTGIVQFVLAMWSLLALRPRTDRM